MENSKVKNALTMDLSGWCGTLTVGSLPGVTNLIHRQAGWIGCTCQQIGEGTQDKKVDLPLITQRVQVHKKQPEERPMEVMSPSGGI